MRHDTEGTSKRQHPTCILTSTTHIYCERGLAFYGRATWELLAVLMGTQRSRAEMGTK